MRKANRREQRRAQALLRLAGGDTTKARAMVALDRSLKTCLGRVQSCETLQDLHMILGAVQYHTDLVLHFLHEGIPVDRNVRAMHDQIIDIVEVIYYAPILEHEIDCTVAIVDAARQIVSQYAHLSGVAVG